MTPGGLAFPACAARVTGSVGGQTLLQRAALVVDCARLDRIGELSVSAAGQCLPA
ncbi:hypothetical protein [Tahibacter sp.]|uniref:hypothetical protein n=1 Tax=Tahibacter sp. TaxID=2056211 RepID=UPI0028C49830|nr:hypothetical protein [Tahibacter sp.]